MADIRFIDEYCIVTDIVTTNNIIAEKLTARVETGHTINKYTDPAVIPVAKLPVLKVGEVQEDNKLYVIDGKAAIKDTKPIQIDPIDVIDNPEFDSIKEYLLTLPQQDVTFTQDTME